MGDTRGQFTYKSQTFYMLKLELQLLFFLFGSRMLYNERKLMSDGFDKLLLLLEKENDRVCRFQFSVSHRYFATFLLAHHQRCRNEVGARLESRSRGDGAVDHHGSFCL